MSTIRCQVCGWFNILSERHPEMACHRCGAGLYHIEVP